MKYKIGDKVVPFQKTCGTQGLENSAVWYNAKSVGQPYLYITNIMTEYYVLSGVSVTSKGDFFSVDDFVPYTEEDPIDVDEYFKDLMMT